MVDWHKVISMALSPIRVKPAATFIHQCVQTSASNNIEIDDVPNIIVNNGAGVAVIENPKAQTLDFIHLGNAILSGARKQNSLPSACDIAITCHTNMEIVIAELTRSKPRSIEGVENKPGIGKRLKAINQLQNTIGYIEKAGYSKVPHKKTAIFFFRLPDNTTDPAARMMLASFKNPALSSITTTVNPAYPDWIFRSNPYPEPYTIC